MSKILGHKIQLALAVLKGKRVELQDLKEAYNERWKLHARRQGVPGDSPPKNVLTILIDDRVNQINQEIKAIEERVKNENL